MELLIVNGNVVTLDAQSTRAQALAIRDGRIVAVGDNGEVLRHRTSKSQILDARGRTVLPGLNEPHGHLHAAAELVVGISVMTPPCQDIADVVAAIRQAASTIPPGEPIIGYGLSYDQLSERRRPTRQDLDKGSTVHPVVLMATGLEAVVNSKALELAGITKETPDPAGGKIGRDSNTGEPDGRLYQYPAYSAVIRHLPPRPRESYLHGFRLAQDLFLQAGITSLCEPKLGRLRRATGIENLKGYQRGVREGVLKIRIYTMIHDSVLKDIGFAVESGLGDCRHRIGGVSIIQDGGIMSKAAAMRQPYQGTEERGWLYYPQEKLDTMVLDMHQQGYQILIHANGDWGMDSALQALEQAQTSHPRASPRHRIERCVICHAEQIQRMKRLGVVPCFSVQYLALQGDAYVDVLLGPERAAKMCPVASALRAGLPALLHSEVMVPPPAPLYNVQCAVMRKTRGGQVLGSEERISVEQALRCVTINPAWFTFEEKLKGTLEIGKFGDVAILEADPFAVSPDEIGQIPVSATIIGGEVAYARPEMSTA